MESPYSFGHWLHWRRRTLDLTQDVLARQAGCAVATIRKLESDERRPSQQLACRLADALTIVPAERAAFLALARGEASVLPASRSAAAGSMPASWPTCLPTNLPTPLTRLIGRRQDVAAVRNLLGGDDTRLLTLIGPPGIGKTRLSIAAAQEVRDTFADGVYFVALAPISDPALVLATITQRLGVKPMATGSPDAQLQHYLRDKHLLLVLDNFEHLLAAGPQVTGLLEAAPGLHVLVTSRAPLQLYGERRFPVPPLVVPDLARLPTVVQMAHSSAVALFVACAQAIMPNFVLTNENAAPTAEICTRLDGLPLAIELVAAHVAHYTPQALLALLADPLGETSLMLLTDGPRDLPLRHQTLRGAITWSYDLLTADVQQLFRRLGVFSGGGTPQAIERVCDLADDLSSDVLNHLASLTDHNLLWHATGTDGEARYAMLETIRAYALERLLVIGEEPTLRQRHAEYYLALAEQTEPNLYSAAHGVQWGGLADENDNLGAALAWSAAAVGRETISVRLAEALWRFWSVGSDNTPAAMRFANCLSLVRKIGNPADIASVLNHIGETERRQNYYGQALAHFAESWALLQSGVVGNAGIFAGMLQLGWHATRQGGIDTHSAANALEAPELWLDRANKQGIAGCLAGLARIADSQQHRERAVRLFAAADALYGNCGAVPESADRAIEHHHIAALHSQLDDMIFAAAWAAGRGLSLEQAITDALGTRAH